MDAFNAIEDAARANGVATPDPFGDMLVAAGQALGKVDASSAVDAMALTLGAVLCGTSLAAALCVADDKLADSKAIDGAIESIGAFARLFDRK